MEYSSGNTTLAATPSVEAETKEDESATVKDRSCDEESEPTTTKKRTWRKPKDKPKRPLSAYNLFFQHARTRVVEGINHVESREEVIHSIESILSKSQPKRRHRKTHGKISFGDLARTIAQEWKSIHPKIKEVFDHYAEIDMVRYRRELKVWKDKKEQESEATAMERFNSFSSQMSSSSASGQFSLDELHDETNSSDAASMRDSTHSSHSSSGEFKSSERRRMKSESMNNTIQRHQQQQQHFSHPGQQYQENASSMSAAVHDLQGNMGGSHIYHNSFVPENYNNEEVARTQWLQQLKIQHAMQMNQMQLLQMRQFQMQQQLEAHRNGMPSSGGMGNRNVMSMGHSPFSGQGINPSCMTQQQNHVRNQGTSFAYTSSMDEGVNHQQQVVQGQPSFVSDYSSSNSFVENSFVPIHQSSGLMNGSLHSSSNHVHQQSNNFTGQDFTHPQISLGDSNFSFSGGHNNADFSSNHEIASSIEQQGLRGMDMGLGG